MPVTSVQSDNRSPFTAGPWEAPSNGRDGAVYAPDAPKGTLWRICDAVRGQTDEECMANSRLISAAPALLSLAQKANELLAPLLDCDPAIREWFVQFRRATDQVEGDDKFWLNSDRIDADIDAAEAAFERRYDDEHAERDEPNAFGERP